MLPKCPYFQQECLREGCTAYYLRDGGRMEWIVKGYNEDQPYCAALKIFLPEGK